MATGTTYNDREFLFRLQTLVIDGGTEVARNIFDQNLKNQPLSIFLANEKTRVNQLRGQKIITQAQYSLLYPSSGPPPTSNDFDLTLIVCLLRNLPSLGLNQNYSWNIPPQPSDTTVEADLIRLKKFRNDIAHISSTTGFQRTSFLAKYAEIEQVLIRLNSNLPTPIANLKQTIDSYKNSPMDPATEKRINDEWDKMEKDLKTEMLQVKDEVASIKKDVSDTKDDVNSIKIDVSDAKDDVASLKKDVSDLKEVDICEIQWRDCLEMTDKARQIEIANILLKNKLFPTQAEIDDTCSVFGRRSKTFLRICSTISEKIRGNSDDVIDVWAAYRYNENIKDKDIKPVFVVITKNGEISINENDFDIIQRDQNVFSAESEKVFMEVENDLSSKMKFPESKLIDLENCVSMKANDLVKNHSNLNIVSPSLKKSRKFGENDGQISDELCIALYVDIKGLIPIAEDPFPSKIGEFHTDVLEGGFKLFHGGPYEYHEQLKMGLAIHADVTNNNGDRMFGTLGGFIDYQSTDTSVPTCAHVVQCALTCAHVVLNPCEMQQLVKQGKMMFQESKKVFQSVCPKTQAFGQVLSAFQSTGDSKSSGMDVALIQINERHPKDGSFPAASNYADAGFDAKNPMVYNKGKIRPLNKIRRRAEVYKYGISTEVTRGSLGLCGSLVKTSELFIGNKPLEYRLHNQIEVCRIDDKCFAEPGDSGALVFFDDTDNDSVAIGIVEGGHSNNRIVYVTPISEILRNIGNSFSMTKFIKDSLVSARSNCPQKDVKEEPMDTS